MLRGKTAGLIALAAGFGASLMAGLPSLNMRAEPPPQAWSGGGRYRSRWPGKAKPAGTKLARLARKGRVGINPIH